MANVLSYQILANAVAGGMCLGPDNNIWIIGSVGTAWYLWKVSPTTGLLATYNLPASYASSTTAVGICADSTYVYVVGTVAANGVGQYTTSGVLNDTFGAGTVHVGGSTQGGMCFDSTFLWVIGGGATIWKITTAGGVTPNVNAVLTDAFSIIYDAGSAALFIGQVAPASTALCKVFTATPTAGVLYGSSPSNCQQITDSTYIWQTHRSAGLTRYLISNPTSITPYAWAGPPSLAGGQLFAYLAYDNTNLWVTALTTVNGFIEISPSTPTQGTQIVASPSTAPAPLESIPMCIGPSTQNPAKAPWAAGSFTVGGTAYLYAYTLTATATANGNLVMVV